MTSLEKALTDLYAEVGKGVEFPDAASKIAIRCKVPYDVLREAYDACESRQSSIRNTLELVAWKAATRRFTGEALTGFGDC